MKSFTSSLILAALVGVSCAPKADAPELNYSPPEGLSWGEGGPSFLTEAKEAEPYTGDNTTVLEAQSRLPTGSALHAEVVLRSCGPLGGVCHNRKEYPDLRTPANFLEIIGAPCNIQSGTPEGVFDRCERPGDQVQLGGSDRSYEIGWLEVIPGNFDDDDLSEQTPGLHIHFARPLGEDVLRYSYQELRFFRVFEVDGKVEKLGYETFSTNWYKIGDGRHIVGEIPDYRVDRVNALLAAGVEQGDLNRNGVFGAAPDEDGNVHGPVPLIQPGDPETSYLVARLRGHMQGEDVPGTRMPLANPPFSVAEMLAMFCFIEGLPENGQVNLASMIDYQNCSYSDPDTHAALAVEGVGSGWADRVAPLLAANCGGCHSTERKEGDLVLSGIDLYNYLISTPSPTDPMGRKFIEPGDPARSYLFLKLIADDSIEGKPMPFDPLEGVRTLADNELSDIEAWIRDGAPP